MISKMIYLYKPYLKVVHFFRILYYIYYILKIYFIDFIKNDLSGPVWGARAGQIRSLIKRREESPITQVSTVDQFPESIIPTVELHVIIKISFTDFLTKII